jgi:hypothetical protein
MAQYLAKDYPFVLKLAAQGQKLSKVEEDVFGSSHAEVGYMLAAKWRLPTVVADCIRYHEHTPEALQSLSEEARQSVELLMLGDLWSSRLGLAFPAGMPAGVEDPRVPEWWKAGLPPFEEILSDLPQEVASKEMLYFPLATSEAANTTA